jgi:hypothetical protein
LKLTAALVMLALLAAPASFAQTVKTFFVTDVGIGRLNGRTLYSPKAVSAAMGGLPVTATTIKFDNISIPVLEATRDGKVVLRVFPRQGGMHISRAIAFAPDAVTSTGVAVGMPMSKVFHRLPNQDCRNGMDQEKGLVFCAAPDMSDVRLEFRCDYATHNDRLPPADVLAKCPLEGIIWISDD